MKKYFSLISVFSVFCLLSSVFTPKAYADTYGNSGSTPTDLVINKEVQNPISFIYVENLGSTDPTFSPGATVHFRLVVKNGSGETMHPVTIVDKLPEYLTFVSANIASSYDKGTNTVTFIIENIIAGDTKTIDITAKVGDASLFPANRMLFCVTNYAKVTAPARPNGDDDTAELCLTVGTNGGVVQGNTNLPVAGVNDVFAILPFLTVGGMGLVLLKKKK